MTKSAALLEKYLREQYNKTGQKSFELEEYSIFPNADDAADELNSLGIVEMYIDGSVSLII